MNFAIEGLSDRGELYKESYRRIVSLQAWRSELLEKIIQGDADDFFKEAQNDALMSHSLARQGAWRVALMCLRSCIENTLFGIYYSEHPVELKQWSTGAHRLGFTEAVTYLSKHPMLLKISEQISGIELIKSEYATLSRAVHGSSKNFRVTKSGEIEGLNVVDVTELSKWATREKNTLIGINFIMLALFRDNIAGAANINLRKAISVVIPENKHNQVKSEFLVQLRSINSVI